MYNNNPHNPIPLDLRKDLPDPMIPWNISPRIFGALKALPSGAGNPAKRTLILPTDPEWRFVWRYFYHDKPKNWGIKRIHCIHQRTQTCRFEHNLAVIEDEASKFSATWNTEPRADQRDIVADRFNQTSAQFSPFETMENDGRRKTWKATKLLPMWHGSDEMRCHSIADTGFTYFGKVALSGAASGSTDSGYFGSGIYFTNSARYSADIYSHGHLLLSWVSMREPFPVVGDSSQQDMALLCGKGAYKHYNAHYVPVNPVGDDYTCAVYHPSQAGQPPICDELVVFQSAQALARYWIELQVEHPSMTAPSGVPAFVEDFTPILFRVLENPQVDADKKLRNVLNAKLAKLITQAGDDDLEDEDTTLYSLVMQLFDKATDRMIKPVREIITSKPDSHSNIAQAIITPIVSASVLPVPSPAIAPTNPTSILAPASQESSSVIATIVMPPNTLPAAVPYENTVRTQPMTVSPLTRAPGVYKGPKESQNVGLLEWELGRKASPNMTFAQAQAYTASRAHAGWRLPTIWELEALYRHKDVLGDDLDNSWFWSETIVVGFNGGALWRVNFDNGRVGRDLVNYKYRVRLVRSCVAPIQQMQTIAAAVAMPLPAPQASVPALVTAIPSQFPAALTKHTVRTQSITVSPLSRTGEWYKGPRESKIVPALEWELGRKDSNEMTLAEAQAYVALPTHFGWRLPTIWELDALYQQKSILGYDLDTEWFWSETAVVDNPDNYWIFYFSNSSVSYRNANVRNRVRLVRSCVTSNQQM